MSAARWLGEFGRVGLSMLGAIFGWVLLAPIALLVPKRHDRIAVIGRQHGRFLDNTKYFFLDAASAGQGFDVAFISEHAAVVNMIATSGFRALRYPHPAALWYLLRCTCVVVDSTDWIRHVRRFLLLRARVVQIWHGVAFKRIELDKWRHETGRYRWFSSPVVFRLRMLLYHFNGRVVRYAAVCSTSRFYRDEVFAPAFLARHYPVTGYPRNGFGEGLSTSASEMVWHNVDVHVRSELAPWAAARRKLVLVAPTMRDSLRAPIALDAVTLTTLNTFAAKHGFEFLFKFHPSDSHAAQVAGRHLHVCAADSDVYPLLPHCDALVTDYSSIYMDFLLLDRPVLFLITDGDSYSRKDREVQFDPASMMPGPRLANWDALLQTLAAPTSPDPFATERARLRRLAFDDLPQDEATWNILSFMEQQDWIKAGS